MRLLMRGWNQYRFNIETDRQRLVYYNTQPNSVTLVPENNVAPTLQLKKGVSLCRDGLYVKSGLLEKLDPRLPILVGRSMTVSIARLAQKYIPINYIDYDDWKKYG